MKFVLRILDDILFLFYDMCSHSIFVNERLSIWLVESFAFMNVIILFDLKNNFMWPLSCIKMTQPYELNIYDGKRYSLYATVVPESLIRPDINLQFIMHFQISSLYWLNLSLMVRLLVNSGLSMQSTYLHATYG